MRSCLPTRLCLGAALAVSLGMVPPASRSQTFPPPLSRREIRRAAPPFPYRGVLLAQNAIRPGIEVWMQNHSNLSPAEQERAFESDPTFRALPPRQQQNLLYQLRLLQAMTPEQRARRWAFLRMTPQQQQQLDAVTQQYAALPPARQRLVRQALAALRRVPPPERQAAMNSYPPLRRFSPYERQLLANLLADPYLAPEGPAAAGSR